MPFWSVSLSRPSRYAQLLFQPCLHFSHLLFMFEELQCKLFGDRYTSPSYSLQWNCVTSSNLWGFAGKWSKVLISTAETLHYGASGACAMDFWLWDWNRVFVGFESKLKKTIFPFHNFMGFEPWTLTESCCQSTKTDILSFNSSRLQT